jgi:hypothetical protein
LARCKHRDLILTRSAYDHKRVRPLKPMVGVVKSLGYYRRGPVGLICPQNLGNKYKKPTYSGSGCGVLSWDLLPAFLRQCFVYAEASFPGTCLPRSRILSGYGFSTPQAKQVAT